MWIQVVFYLVLLAAFFIFMKLSDFEINGRKILSLKYRILIALVFPVLIVLFILFGIFILMLIIFVLIVLGITFLFNLFRIREVNIFSF